MTIPLREAGRFALLAIWLLLPAPGLAEEVQLETGVAASSAEGSLEPIDLSEVVMSVSL
jgi:hypothetical protein